MCLRYHLAIEWDFDFVTFKYLFSRENAWDQWQIGYTTCTIHSKEFWNMKSSHGMSPHHVKCYVIFVLTEWLSQLAPTYLVAPSWVWPYSPWSSHTAQRRLQRRALSYRTLFTWKMKLNFTSLWNICSLQVVPPYGASLFGGHLGSRQGFSRLQLTSRHHRMLFKRLNNSHSLTP